MPVEEMEWMPQSNLMSTQEILKLAEIFVSLGVKKIRLTGGEPLVRKDFGQILEELA
jgi:cyclic pyranopterin phosphate synthase